MVAASLFGLFIAAFLAATPLPFQSEIVFLGLMASGSIAVWLLVIVASVGNTLGSCVTYAAGRGLGGARGARWFPVRPDQLGRAERWFQRWGLWALLVSWAPGGDLIVALDGSPVTGPAELRTRIISRHPGDRVEIEARVRRRLRRPEVPNANEARAR